VIIEHLQQHGTVPAGTKKEKVQQVMKVLCARLYDRLNTPFRWLAVCTVAVSAGYQAADKKIRKRKKLRAMIQACADYLGADDPTSHFKGGWENANMTYGYGAVDIEAERLETTADQIIMNLIRRNRPSSD
jgi:hypothetical protein